MITLLPVEDVRTDGGTQPRAQMDTTTLDDYVEDMKCGAQFPPLTVFYDDSEYWLADGYHRLAAAIKVEVPEIDAEVHQGTRRDALLYSLGANTKHGLRRSNADKRRAVLTLLRDSEWGAWSNREIARRSQTSHTFVAKMRKEHMGQAGEDEPVLSAQETLEAGVLSPEQEAGLVEQSAEDAASGGAGFDESLGGPEPLNFGIEERPTPSEDMPPETPFYDDMPPGEQYAPVQAFESSGGGGGGAASSGGGTKKGTERPTDAEMEVVLDLLGSIEKLSPGARLLLFEELRMRFHDFFAAAA